MHKGVKLSSVSTVVLWRQNRMKTHGACKSKGQSNANKNEIDITKTCSCNVYPLEPHFYIAKLGYAGVYIFFLFLLQNIDCGYSLEAVLTCRGGSNVYPQCMF